MTDRPLRIRDVATLLDVSTETVPRWPGNFENVRRRDWRDAMDTAGITKPVRIFGLRSTLISNALARGRTFFETARIPGNEHTHDRAPRRLGALAGLAADPDRPESAQ